MSECSPVQPVSPLLPPPPLLEVEEIKATEEAHNQKRRRSNIFSAPIQAVWTAGSDQITSRLTDVEGARYKF